jgi:hypothetical protein
MARNNVAINEECGHLWRIGLPVKTPAKVEKEERIR